MCSLLSALQAVHVYHLLFSGCAPVLTPVEALSGCQSHYPTMANICHCRTYISHDAVHKWTSSVVLGYSNVCSSVCIAVMHQFCCMSCACAPGTVWQPDFPHHTQCPAFGIQDFLWVTGILRVRHAQARQMHLGLEREKSRAAALEEEVQKLKLQNQIPTGGAQDVWPAL